MWNKIALGHLFLLVFSNPDVLFWLKAYKLTMCITHLAVFMIDHHIMWLHISMHDSHAVAVVQGLQRREQRDSKYEISCSKYFQKNNRLQNDAAYWTKEEKKKSNFQRHQQSCLGNLMLHQPQDV